MADSTDLPSRRGLTANAQHALRTVLELALFEGREWIATGDLAEFLSIPLGTATFTIRMLVEAGLAVHRKYEGIRLTKRGRRVAARAQRRFRLAELFLTRSLQLAWDEALLEADRLEHGLSDHVANVLDGFLGLPTHDSFGNPLPDAAGKLRSVLPTTPLLCEIEVAQNVRIARVALHRPELMRYLETNGLLPGRIIEVLKVDPVGGIVLIRGDAGEFTMGFETASSLHVEIVSPHAETVRFRSK